MELFHRAKAVRLRSHHDKYLIADEGEDHVQQDRLGSARAARWTVEFVDNVSHALRLKSCYGRYLTASNEPFLLGVTGKKVLQTLPARLDSSVEWEPVREGFQVKLKTRYGNYLRGNGGLPPWRNSVTHDVPHRTATQDWILWEVEIMEILPQTPQRTQSFAPAPAPVAPSPAPSAYTRHSSAPPESDFSDQVSSSSSTPRFSRLESSYSFDGPIRKVEGRSIFYTLADDRGNVDDDVEWPSLTFIGTDMGELTELLKNETRLDEIIVCTRNPLNQSLTPLSLQLPPNNHDIRLVLVDANSRAGQKLSTR